MITIRTFFAAAVAAAVLTLPASAQTADFKPPKQCAPASTMGGMDDHSMGHGDDAPKPMTDMMGMGDMDLAAMPEHVQKKTFHRSNRRSCRAFVVTKTHERLIAAAAIISN